MTEPALRLELTPAQARQLDRAKPPGDAVFVLGYAARHSWPHPQRFSMVLAFTSFEKATRAAEACGLLEPRRKRQKARGKPRKAPRAKARKRT